MLHKKVLKVELHLKYFCEYLDFWRKNRDVLLDGKLTAAAPESAYSQVCAEKEDRAIITAYTDRIVNVQDGVETTVVNCTKQEKLMILGALGRAYHVRNCMGKIVYFGLIKHAIEEIAVPQAGMLTVE